MTGKWTVAGTSSQVVATRNETRLTVISRPERVVLRATAGDKEATIVLGPVAHHRLAAHLARALGVLPMKYPEDAVAWTMPGPSGGLSIGAPIRDGEDSTWAVPMNDPEQIQTVTRPELLWPLYASGARAGDDPGAYALRRFEGEHLAHYRPVTGMVTSEALHSPTKALYIAEDIFHLEYRSLFEWGTPVVPEAMDLDLGAARVLIRPAGVVVDDGFDAVSCVLDLDQHRGLLRALSIYLPKPDWVLG